MSGIPEIGIDLLESVGIQQGTVLFELFESGFELAPYVGKVIQFIKIRRLQNRINKHDKEIQQIKLLLNHTKLPFSFIKERVTELVTLVTFLITKASHFNDFPRIP